MNEEFAVLRTPRGWRVDAFGLIYEIEGIRIDRGNVRATLAVSRGESVVYPTTANLTSPQTRGQIVKALAERGYQTDDRPLIALYDAARRRPQGDSEPVSSDTPSHFSYKQPSPRSLEQLISTYRRYLEIKDVVGTLIVPTAVLASHQLPGERCWLLVVGPPSSAKTAVLRGADGYPKVYMISDLTARTFVSGYLPPDGSDPSLLARLTDECLVLKDMTSLLSKDERELVTVLGQLREIHDGSYHRDWGSGKPRFEWHGRLGFLAGVTGVIDRHHGVMSALGERFLMVRPVQPGRFDNARKAVEQDDDEGMHAETRDVLHGFLASRRSYVPSVDSATLDCLARIADFATRARSHVVRDGRTRAFLYAPDPEGPGRMAKALRQLGRGLAIVEDAEAVRDTHLAIALRVALDSMPVLRRRVLEWLAETTLADSEEKTSEIGLRLNASTATVRLALEDLEAVGVLSRSKSGREHAWRLRDEHAAVFAELTTAYAKVATFYERWGRVSPDTESSVTPNGHVHIECERCGERLGLEDIRAGRTMHETEDDCYAAVGVA